MNHRIALAMKGAIGNFPYVFHHAGIVARRIGLWQSDGYYFNGIVGIYWLSSSSGSRNGHAGDRSLCDRTLPDQYIADGA